MMKFLSLIALLGFVMILGATGIDPPRDHAPPGYEIAISDAEEIAIVADVIAFQNVTDAAIEVPLQPPGVLYELSITQTEHIYIINTMQPACLTANYAHNQALYGINKEYNNYQHPNSYPQIIGKNKCLFRTDRTRFV